MSGVRRLSGTGVTLQFVRLSLGLKLWLIHCSARQILFGSLGGLVDRAFSVLFPSIAALPCRYFRKLGS